MTKKLSKNWISSLLFSAYNFGLVARNKEICLIPWNKNHKEAMLHWKKAFMEGAVTRVKGRK